MNDQQIKNEKAASKNIFKFTCNQLQKTQDYVKNRSRSKTDDVKLKRDKNQDRHLTDTEQETLKKNKKCFLCKQEEHMIRDCSQKISDQ